MKKVILLALCLLIAIPTVCLAKWVEVEPPSTFESSGKTYKTNGMYYDDERIARYTDKGQNFVVAYVRLGQVGAGIYKIAFNTTLKEYSENDVPKGGYLEPVFMFWAKVIKAIEANSN